MATILVVDDDADVRGLLHRVLEEAGYHVLEAPNAKRAMALCHQAAIDLIITDIDMSGMSGIEMIRQLKTFPRKLIAMSGSRNIRYVREIVRLFGVQRTFEKPLPMTELLAEIADQLNA